MTPSRLLGSACVLLSLTLAGSDAHGEATNGVGTCQTAQGSLALLGCSLARQLLPTAAGAPVRVLELKTDRELPSADALRERVQRAVALALGSAPPASSKPSQPSKLRVELRIEKAGGVLRLTAEVRRATGLWQRIRHKQPRAELHAFAEAPLDAELRSLIPPPPLVVSDTLKLKAPERGIVAVACGPLGIDGGQELALVSRSSVRVGRIVGRAFAERKRVAWSALSPVAPAPLREPIASAEITADGRLRLGLSDRRDGLELSRELEVLQRFDHQLPVPGGGCALRGGVGLLLPPVECAARGGSARAPSLQVDAIAGSGAGWLARELSRGVLTAAASELSAAARPVGAQLAGGDADNDGNPELLFSEDTTEPAKDRLTLATLLGRRLSTRFELAVPGIQALSICVQREGPGMAPLVVASSEELWLIR